VKAPMIKFVRSKIAVLALVASTIPSWATGLLAVQSRNCTWCHGESAQGYGPAPRLAGQSTLYIENQLLSFRSHTRDNPFSKQYMWGAAANLSPGAVRNLANYFSTLSPKVADDGDKQKAVAGRALYEDGNPDANTVACAVCHGPNAQGIRDIPRLGGLSYYYLKRRLVQWGEGYHGAAKSPMPQVASKLSANQIEALASYLSFVK
jgi:cytochrome c553